MAKATDIATLQSQVTALAAIVQALVVYVGDYPPEDTWHAAKKQAVDQAKALIQSVT
jgi:hypothetical protein